MIISKIIIYVLLFLLPAIQLIRDWKYFDKRSRNFHLVTKIIFVAYILLVLPSAYFLWVDLQEGRKLQGYITGGDSYCYINLSPKNKTTFQIIVANEGEYPIFDVSIRMVDRQKFGPPETQTIDSLVGATTFVNLQRMPAARALDYGQGKYPNSDRVDYLIFILAQNRSLVEYFSSRQIGGRWVSAYKIMSQDEKETFLERSDPTFPHDAMGQVQW